MTRAVTAGVGDGASRGVPHLFSPAPNPFQRATTIRFDLPKAGDVRLNVYDVAGRLVRTLVSESLPVGNRNVTWNGVDDTGQRVSAGVYVLRLETAGSRENRRMLLLK